MAKLILEINNLHFKVQLLDNLLANSIDQVNVRLTTYTWTWNSRLNRLFKTMDKSYYTYDKKCKVFRFPIMMLRNFLLTMGNAGVTKDDIILRYDTEINHGTLDLEFTKDITLRDYQTAYSEAIMNNQDKKLLLIDLQTGKGKTAIAMDVILKLNMTTAILILPKYIEKWVDDLYIYSNVKKEDICVIKGGKSLVDLMEGEQPKFKFYIFSIRTISNYIADYEALDNTAFAYPIVPQDLFKKLNIGTIFNDETHQHFHALNKALSYFDGKIFIGSTATFDSNNRDMKRVYDYIIPSNHRVSNLVEYDTYINVMAIRYQFSNLKGVRYKRQKGYNHILFETSIIFNNRLLQGYLEMINYYVEESYIRRMEKGDRLIIFAASIKFCTLLTEELKKKYQHLDVRRYVEDDPYENVQNSDILCTTVLSAGTAFDVHNLITVIQTVPMNSLQANLQSLGRLRKLPNKECWYYYLYSSNIPSHNKMHQTRYMLFKEKVKSFIFNDYQKML